MPRRIFIDNVVLDQFRERAKELGTGYQTMINEALKHYLADSTPLVTEEGLRKVLRQEMPGLLRGSTTK